MRHYLKHFNRLLKHKWLVYKAGRITGISLWRLITHDLSKFSPVEFVNYAIYFKNQEDRGQSDSPVGRINSGDKTLDIERWAVSWLHHLHNNPHHPEFWVISWRGDPSAYDSIGERLAPFVSVLPMPVEYVKEMVADWLATGYAVTGSWDFSDWLNENLDAMLMHLVTRHRVEKVLYDIGFSRTVLLFRDGREMGEGDLFITDRFWRQMGATDKTAGS